MNSAFEIFKEIPPEGHLYFFYGLVFFILGISILLTYKKKSELIVSSSLWLMAVFGFTHGIYVWLELLLLLPKQDATVFQRFPLNGLKIILFILSYLFLVQFGSTLICHTIRNRRKKLLVSAIPVVLLLFWIVPLWNHIIHRGSELLDAAYFWAKYTFGLTGALLTAFGLWSVSSDVKHVSTIVTKKFFYAGIVFLFFGIVSVIVPSLTLIPYVDIPVEVFRALSVVLITYFVLTAVNIFEIETKRRLEKQVNRIEQSEKLISIGRLAAGIAHEINNPLTNVSLSLEILRTRLKEINNPEIMTRLDSMERNIGKAATIAKELLQFSRNVETDMIPINMNSIIKGSLTLMNHKFEGMHVHTNLSNVPDIIGDPVKIEQVIINILDNAHQAMDTGDEIWIESLSRNDSIMVKIVDSGKGISREDLPRIFDPFFTTKHVGVGTGLGLSICYGIIDQHQGDISIESKEGNGTVVTITLPVNSEIRAEDETDSG